MPVDQRSLQLLGLRIGYRESGPPDGDPLVLVHGWAASSRMWLGTIEHLQSRYRCLALDLPGHGLSENPPIRWHTVENYAEICRRFRDELALPPAVMIGHSMGGLLALEVAIRDPELYRGLVLVCPAVGRPVNSSLSIPHWVRSPILRLTKTLQPLSKTLVTAAPSSWFPGSREVAERSKHDLRDLTPESALGSISSLMDHTPPNQVRELSVPTLVIGGRKDRLVPAEQVEALAEHMPNARAVLLDSAHHPFHETPYSFLRETIAFLESLEGV